MIPTLKSICRGHREIVLSVESSLTQTIISISMSLQASDWN